MINPRSLARGAFIGTMLLVVVGCPPANECVVPGTWLLELRIGIDDWWKGEKVIEEITYLTALVDLKEDGTVEWTGPLYYGDEDYPWSGTWSVDDTTEEPTITIILEVPLMEFVMEAETMTLTGSVDCTLLEGTMTDDYGSYDWTLRKIEYCGSQPQVEETV